MRVEVKPDHVQFEEEEHGEHYIKDRVKSLALVKNLSFLAIVLLIAQIVLDSIHLSLHKFDLTVSLLTTAIVFLIGAGLVIYWAGQATKAYKANTELFQPRVNDRLTKSIYIAGLIFAATAIVLVVNLLAQRTYSPDYVTAYTAVDATWDENFSGRTEAGVNKFLRVIQWIQVGFNVFYIIYFLVVARTAFKCLKFDNQAMSYLTFLGNTLLLAFGLAVIYLADHALGYSAYAGWKEHFPFWNIRGLYFAGICVAAVSLLGFLVDHRSWRVGFLVLSFLLLVLIVLLGNFTGFAFRHVNETYSWYKGDNCLATMKELDLRDLEGYGCPQKYLPPSATCDNTRVAPWEPLEAVVADANRPAQTASNQQAATQTAPAPAQQAAADQAQAQANADQQAANQAQAAADASQDQSNQDQQAATETQANADASQEQANQDQQAATETQANADASQDQANQDQQAATETQANADASQEQANQDQQAATDAQATADTSQANADASQQQADNTAAASDNTAAPTDNQAASSDNTAAPTDNQAASSDNAAASTDNQAAASDNAAASTDNQAAAGDNSAASTDNQAAAGDNTAASTDNQAAVTGAETTTMFFELDPRRLQTTSDDGLYCLNSKCCGLLGQIYTQDVLFLANFGLLSMLAAILISVACYYFWFVKWVDAARDKRKDYIWLFVMIATIIAFIVAFAFWPLSYPAEKSVNPREAL